MRRLAHALILAALTGCATQQVGDPPIDDDAAVAGDDVQRDDAKTAADVQISSKDDVVSPGDDVVSPGDDVVSPPLDAPVTDPDAGVVGRDVVLGRDIVLGIDIQLPRDSGVTTDTGVTPACRATTCGACTPMGSCGWCGATSTCLPGTSAGPTAGACATGWAWTSSDCPVAPPDRCTTFNASCNTCTPNAGCGWCRSTRRCMGGTATGPTDTAACPASDWAWIQSACTTPGDPCASSGGCASCASRSSCGWCDDSDTCHSGSSSGPSSGACTSGHWTWRTVLGLFCL